MRAHLFLCLLAAYVRWHLERAWAPLLFSDEAPPARTDAVAPPERSAAARAKDRLQRTPDDLPVHGFRTLLAELGTLTRNRVVMAGSDERAAFEILAEPTPSRHVPCSSRASRPRASSQNPTAPSGRSVLGYGQAALEVRAGGALPNGVPVPFDRWSTASPRRCAGRMHARGCPALRHRRPRENVPLDFLKRRGGGKPGEQPEMPALLPEEVEAQEYSVKLQYRGKTSEGVRMTAGPAALRELPNMLVGIAKTPVEVIEPLGNEFESAAPLIQRPAEAMQWINAHHDHSPIARHALVVLESVDAIDLAFETFATALLEGEVDTSGYPEYNAVVGGVASHWDEATGDIIVRAVVGWGGRGVRGDTDRAGQKLLVSLLGNILASQHAVGMAGTERPVPAAGAGGLVCAHCGFSSGHERAFYCPKCGMRLLRG